MTGISGSAVSLTPRLGSAPELPRAAEATASRTTSTKASASSARPGDTGSAHLRGRALTGTELTGTELTREEREQVEELKKTDRQVRQHEAAHKAAAGSYAGPASYSYTVGPDGKRYAVAGEVSIDTSAVPGDPQATVQKMNQIARAALAPANPSSTDRAVAAQARDAAARAHTEIATERRAARGDLPPNPKSALAAADPSTARAATASYRPSLFVERGGLVSLAV